MVGEGRFSAKTTSELHVNNEDKLNKYEVRETLSAKGENLQKP